MKKVIFFSSGKGKNFFDLILKHLSAQYEITAAGGHVIMTSGSGEKLFLLFSENTPEKIALSHALLIFAEDFFPASKLEISQNCVCIASSENTRLLDFLALNKVPVITCGMSPKDTVTYSGRGDTSVSVSLQRKIIDCKAETIEPLELVFTPSRDVSSYLLLAYAALNLWLNNEKVLRAEITAL